jgi:predicted DNA-binding transcriptional regulator AlpA
MARWLSYRGVTELTSLSESTVRRLVAEGKLPKPQELTPGRKVFEAAAVETAVEALIAERRRLRSGSAAKAYEALQEWTVKLTGDLTASIKFTREAHQRSEAAVLLHVKETAELRQLVIQRFGDLGKVVVALKKLAEGYANLAGRYAAAAGTIDFLEKRVAFLERESRLPTN